MLKFEVEIFARETIKPSSPQIHDMKPFKLSFFDQFTPSTYATQIFFYSATETTTTATILPQLKTSLSQTLNLLYPFSGRIKDNMSIHGFGKGVPFISARAGCRLAELVKQQEVKSLNKLLPCHPFSKESNNEMVPLLVCQVTIFACGGIALGLAYYHKITDAHVAFLLCSVWSKICGGSGPPSPQDVGFHGLDEASKLFPPRNVVPQNYLSTMENLWFPGSNNSITKRFTFHAKSITQLRAIAKGEHQATPSRVQALSGFILKRCMAASRTISGSSKPSVVAQAASLRPRILDPSLLQYSIGSLIWFASCAADIADESGTELSELVKLMGESVAAYDGEYLNSLQGEAGFEAMGELISQLETMFSSESEKPDIFAFTSWCHHRFYELDFGWGKPVWVAPFGEIRSEFMNHAVLIGTKCGAGIEAWITLDEQRMSLLEKDAEFLKFASPNPKISSL
ncbi:hypothetical protein like AT3G26040 [Hibiscus trionum]|uniref:Vinorine synthase-like n=1 Tax=Hibiscus trionum TaxID=183268 RepID=A0A9W7M479_HIBTR|nr:hypothetical protein like AT3G26040 [Hibiscus trionum]